ncbi:MAG: DUF4835 family protein [Flavobacteriaceae bacterium]|nr:DUF4835 family protein [Flavobacteriaceae bacterium]MDG1791197.1 DUF4835 family protein [Flavobacteriaceae bacterium]MDG2446789.1 DUF4835 family protein [Flavobacteriaceae bacterium]
MSKKIVLFFILCASLASSAQELNCTVSINAEQTGQPNNQIFRTLETQLTEFINTTSWTDKNYKNQEKIDCNMSIIINSFDANIFNATIQIQASRPVYQSTYSSPIYNYNDKQFNFSYVEFQPLVFNINSFDSNLVSVIAFHVYTIIGLDSDTFELNGGEPYFSVAKQIVNTAATGGSKGWKSTDGKQSRYSFNDALVSQVYKEFHSVMYNYHRLGMDKMHNSPKVAKLSISAAINTLKGINDRRPNSYLLRTFFDAKSNEIENIFSDGPAVNITSLVDNLNRIAPTKRANWSKIRY